jgi:sodium-independent sulfate anion transporter 11
LTSLKNLGPLKKVGFLRGRAVDSSLLFIATSRNAIAVIAGCLAAYFLEQNCSKSFTLTDHFHFQMQLGIFIYKFRHQ